MPSFDYKKNFKELYLPKETPSVIDVPEMTFIQIDGKGNPNDPDGEYNAAVGVLYSLAYTIKMMPKNNETPKDYFAYVMPPLEGFWCTNDNTVFDYSDKSKFCWTSMIRQPEFVTDEVFKLACELVEKKKKLDTSKARLARVTEGLCVQCMHIGEFDAEPATIDKIHAYIDANGLICDITDTRRHHEIYLGDPRKCDAAKMRTVLRYPVRRA